MAQAKQQTKTQCSLCIRIASVVVVVVLVVCLLTNFKVKYFWEFLPTHRHTVEMTQYTEEIFNRFFMRNKVLRLILPTKRKLFLGPK